MIKKLKYYKNKNIFIKYFSNLKNEEQLQIDYYIQQLNVDLKNRNFFYSKLEEEFYKNNKQIKNLIILKKIVSSISEKEEIQLKINNLNNVNEKINEALGLKKKIPFFNDYKELIHRIYFKIIFFNSIMKDYIKKISFKIQGRIQILYFKYINKDYIKKIFFKIQETIKILYFKYINKDYIKKIFFKIQERIKILYFKYINKDFWKKFLKSLFTIKFWEDLYYYCFVELQKPKVFSDSLFDQIDLHFRLICIFFYYIFLCYYIILIVGCWLLSVFGFL